MVFDKLKSEAEISLRHLQILKAVLEKQPIGIFKLSEMLNMPKHKVRYSLRVLEQAGIIVPTQHGARVRDEGYDKIEGLKKEIEEIKVIVNQIDEMIKKL
ncbi:MAG: ArsR family transcriptional regulator [Archaeoglobaceae archaeon]|nr:ArsR family transcriptional regulator [Archaeoglobaceae archaeon]MCX8152095.1 ArsR family transcriptional regulator [Archaeoglobaceae archaeon]MDW8013530.1 ArsR family transcriptional regulator [Archaeoglobaceae archaeon]